MIIEHRKHMRIDDRLVVSWRPADSDKLAAEDLRDVMLVSVNRQINDMIAALAGTEPDIAQILVHLNHKVDLLADESGKSHHGPSLTRVNISRSGVAFEWHTDIEAGSIIRFTVALPPENNKITLVARILSADPTDSEERIRIRCHFLDGQSEKIEAVQRYIDFAQEMRKGRNRLLAPIGSQGDAVTDSAAVLHYR